MPFLLGDAGAGDTRVLVHEDVVRLDVAVHHVVAVEVLQPRDALRHQPLGLHLRQPFGKIGGQDCPVTQPTIFFLGRPPTGALVYWVVTGAVRSPPGWTGHWAPLMEEAAPRWAGLGWTTQGIKMGPSHFKEQILAHPYYVQMFSPGAQQWPGWLVVSSP